MNNTKIIDKKIILVVVVDGSADGGYCIGGWRNDVVVDFVNIDPNIDNEEEEEAEDETSASEEEEEGGEASSLTPHHFASFSSFGDVVVDENEEEAEWCGVDDIA
ncbi:hypothetical protein GW17_00033366 [Ensete ventricosum]|nr:hypothetical protein GW17_00033366 [Ensete ventricosum]RZR80830.1 hypothetical protein BHM03_00006923 [Ensete ventricosum]